MSGSGGAQNTSNASQKKKKTGEKLQEQERRNVNTAEQGMWKEKNTSIKKERKAKKSNTMLEKRKYLYSTGQDILLEGIEHLSLVLG